MTTRRSHPAWHEHREMFAAFPHGFRQMSSFIHLWTFYEPYARRQKGFGYRTYRGSGFTNVSRLSSMAGKAGMPERTVTCSTQEGESNSQSSCDINMAIISKHAKNSFSNWDCLWRRSTPLQIEIAETNPLA